MLAVALVLLSGCERKPATVPLNTELWADTNAPAKAVVVNVPVPEIDKPVPTGDKVDPASIRPDNPGYVLDMNGDGVADFIQLRGNTVYFKDKNAGAEVPILVIKLSTIAYNITSDAIYFWDTNRDGYIQRKIGVNGSLPYFGNMESQ